MNSTLAPPQPSFTCLKQFRDLTQHLGLRGGPGGGVASSAPCKPQPATLPHLRTSGRCGPQVRRPRPLGAGPSGRGHFRAGGRTWGGGGR